LPRLSSTRTKFGQFGCETQKLKLFRKQGDHRCTMVYYGLIWLNMA
jgi:hypothetical protein